MHVWKINWLINANDPRPTATTWKVMSGWVRSFPPPQNTRDFGRKTHGCWVPSFKESDQRYERKREKKRNRFESDTFGYSPNLSMIRVPRLRIQSLQFVWTMWTSHHFLEMLQMLDVFLPGGVKCSTFEMKYQHILEVWQMIFFVFGIPNFPLLFTCALAFSGRPQALAEDHMGGATR